MRSTRLLRSIGLSDIYKVLSKTIGSLRTGRKIYHFRGGKLFERESEIISFDPRDQSNVSFFPILSARSFRVRVRKLSRIQRKLTSAASPFLCTDTGLATVSVFLQCHTQAFSGLTSCTELVQNWSMHIGGSSCRAR